MNTLIKLYIENRKAKRVLGALKLEAARLRMAGDKDMARYVEHLVEWLEEA
jgi:hypothetical protein